jgi:hypothetical protein
MFTLGDAFVIGICLEGFFYGKISVLCALTCTLARSPIIPRSRTLFRNIRHLFTIPIKRAGRQPSFSMLSVFSMFYLLLLLSVIQQPSRLIWILPVKVTNQVRFFFSVVRSHFATLSLQLQTDSQPVLIPYLIVQIIITGLCDFIAQCIIVSINHCTYQSFYSPKFSKIYRCWIVWGQNIRVVIIPSFLAIAFLGQ